MLNKVRNRGQYQGCFADSHWGKKRREQHWDIFCDIAPKQAQKYAELPNKVRPLLGINVLKHTNSKFALEDGVHAVPMPLALAAENILVDRIHCGEEVTTDFVSKLLLDMIDIWNSNVQKLSEEVQLSMGHLILKHCDDQVRDDMGEDEVQALQQAGHAKLEAVLQNLRPCTLKQDQNALKLLGLQFLVMR